MKGLNRLRIVLCACCCSAGAAYAGPVVEFVPQANGELRPSEGVLRAIGVGLRPKDADSPSQARLLARAAAVADAYRCMAQMLNEVRVLSSTSLERHAATGDSIRLNVEAYIRGAQVTDEREDADGTYTVMLQVGIYGKNALTGMLPPGTPRGQLPAPTLPVAAPAAIMPDVPKAIPPEQAPVAAPDRSLEPDLVTPAADEGPFTGLVIDARGLGVQPAMSPRIYDPAGTEIYGTVNVDPSFAEETGVAGYMGTIKAALALPRVGQHPLVVRASATPDSFRRCVTVSAEDARRILAANEKGRFLEKCAVAIIVDERRARDEAPR